MMIRIIFICCAFSMSILAQSMSDSSTIPHKEALELGGLVTVDYGGNIDSLSRPAFSVGKVNLGANVFISKEVSASIVVAAETKLDSLFVYQAMVSYHPEGEGSFEMLFGQLFFNHGLLPTRMISYPLITDAVYLGNPGIVFNYTIGMVRPGLGLTVWHTDGDSAPGETIEYGMVVNGDLLINNETGSIARLSAHMQENAFDLDGGITFVYDNLTLDAELHGQLDDYSEINVSGLFTGAAWTFFDRLTAALRFDLITDDAYRSTEKQVALGATFDIKDGIFCALEFDHVMPSTNAAYQKIALQVGLSSTLKLPGFQRSTLTNKE